MFKVTWSMSFWDQTANSKKGLACIHKLGVQERFFLQKKKDSFYRFNIFFIREQKIECSEINDLTS